MIIGVAKGLRYSICKW